LTEFSLLSTNNQHLTLFTIAISISRLRSKGLPMKKISIAIAIELAFLLCFITTTPAGATPQYTLTLSAQGSGTVTPDNTNSLHPANVNITVTAAPSTGWYFANWSGDASGTINPLIVTMTSNLVITGNFLAYPTYALTLTTNGQGFITLDPTGGLYYSNETVTATATPATGWVFAGWSGATNGMANPASLVIDTNTSLMSTFAELPAFDAQPISVTNVTGSTVTFSAHSVGTAPVAYEWFFSGGSLTNATNPTLSLTNATALQGGNYWVVATNAYGSATSDLASLTITKPSGPTNVVSSPNEASLLAAIAMGGWVGLEFNGAITLTNTITITNNVVLDGSGFAPIISGGNAVQLFYVTNGTSLTLSNLTLANGSCLLTSIASGINADAGAIYNHGGTVTLVGCTVTNNTAQALVYGGVACGGAIFNNNGTLVLYADTIISNSAIAGGANTGSDYDVNLINYGLGGAIYNTNGAVTISGGSLNGNFCQGLSTSSDLSGVFTLANGLTMGGAIFQASGNLTITNAVLAFNEALGGGGAAYAGHAYTGPASPAYGGAVALTGGSGALNHSQFLANTAKGGDAGTEGDSGPGFGGALYSAATVSVQDSSFSSNLALAGNGTIYTNGANGYGGAIYNCGVAILNRCAVYSNYVQGGNTYTTVVTNQSGVYTRGGIAGPGPNGSAFGGGIFNVAQLMATNCTIGLNSGVGYLSYTINGEGIISFLPAGSAFGGGVFNNSNAVFYGMNLTIASNSCSAIGLGLQLANTNGSLSLQNSLVAGPQSNVYGSITDDGYNICSDSSARLESGSSYNNTDPQLASLGNYGGSTWCMALLGSSPAIDFIFSTNFPPTDQRGYARPAGSYADAGAYEYGAVPFDIPYLILSPSGTNLLLSFIGYPTKSYRLQYSTNLIAWSDLRTNGPVTLQTNINQMISKPAPDRCFFRLLTQ
jgi:hypothetical protein